VTREQANALVHAGLTRLEDLLSAEAGDIADLKEIGENAAVILAAAQAEAERRALKSSGASVNP
jgi:predicted RecB family nuclease